LLDFGGTAVPQVEARWLAPAAPGGTAQFLAVVTGGMAARQSYAGRLGLGPEANPSYAYFARLSAGESDTFRISVPIPDSARGEMPASFSVNCPGSPYASQPILIPLTLEPPEIPAAQALH